MFCVIQEIQRKKQDQYGNHRKIEVYSYEISGNPKYRWEYAGGRFERPILTTYKISIHESKRVNGVVTKRQFPVTTVSYYSLMEYGIWDCIRDGKMEAIAATMDEPEDHLWDLLYAKVDPLQERIRAEFADTPEGKAKARHERIIDKYQTAKAVFGAQYGVDQDQYDFCYDVFGNLMNRPYLDAITSSAKQRERASRSYQKAGSSNYSGGYDYSKLFGAVTSTYSDGDRTMLKQFYRSLSKIYHPDANLDTDTHAEMVLLNKLKEDWGV